MVASDGYFRLSGRKGAVVDVIWHFTLEKEQDGK